MEGAIMMVLIVAVPVGLWVLIQWHKESQNKEFAGYLRGLAPKVSGQVVMKSGRLKPRLAFERAGVQAQLGLYRASRELSIEFDAMFKKNMGLHLYLSPGTSVLELLLKPVGLERIKLGKPSIDDHFYLACSDQAAAADLLDSELREKLERRVEKPLFFEILIKKDRLRIKTGVFDDPEDLERFLDLAIEFLDRLALKVS